MKVVGYVRVSTEEQATQGVSLQAQEAKLRQCCDLYGHDLAEVVIDAGQSAKSLNRPGLSRVLAAAGHSFSQAARRLTAEGFQTLKGGTWSGNHLKRLLAKGV
jgi:hypothetical protein